MSCWDGTEGGSHWWVAVGGQWAGPHRHVEAHVGADALLALGADGKAALPQLQPCTPTRRVRRRGAPQRAVLEEMLNKAEGTMRSTLGVLLSGWLAAVECCGGRGGGSPMLLPKVFPRQGTTSGASACITASPACTASQAPTRSATQACRMHGAASAAGGPSQTRELACRHQKSAEHSRWARSRAALGGRRARGGHLVDVCQAGARAQSCNDRLLGPQQGLVHLHSNSRQRHRAPTQVP
jgi:hypothetical protein